ncbi:hypothetical protein F4781DRAFT_445210 [Annulohypoxylon bovei var. microspora]|nr:hypothetical protein F4781DRAFT_445210 [Annulohypoxylon bovei var. microspora]
MVQKPTNVSSTGDPKNTRTRSPDSAVWGGTKARDLVSSVRFSWDKYQRVCFVKFLETVGLGFKNANITPLLVQLNLDGYEDIENDCGENVHDLIEDKVRRKLKNTAGELGEEALKRASFGSKTVDPTPREEPVTVPKNKTPKSPENISKSSLDSQVDKRNGGRHDTTAGTVQPPQSNHPFLKMPKQRTSASSSSPRHEVKLEEEPLPLFTFQGSRSSPTGQSTPSTGTIKSESSALSAASSEFSIPGTPSKARTSRVDASEADSAKRSRARRSIQRLVSCLKRADSALEEVESAFDDLPHMESGRELAYTIHHLRTTFNDAQVDAEEVDDILTADLGN